jgi:hypothetical protein
MLPRQSPAQNINYSRNRFELGIYRLLFAYHDHICSAVTLWNRRYAWLRSHRSVTPINYVQPADVHRAPKDKEECSYRNNVYTFDSQPGVL